jgi:hypothetical protein
MLAKGTIDIAHRRPVEMTHGSGDMARHFGHFALQRVILRHTRPAARRHLQIGDPPHPRLIEFKKPAIGRQPLRQALGIIQPVDTHHQLLAAERLAKAPHSGIAHRILCRARKALDIDADGKGLDHKAALGIGIQPGPTLGHTRQHPRHRSWRHPRNPPRDAAALEADAQIIGVSFGLQPDQIIGGHMHEKADTVAYPHLTQFRGQRDQMIIMHPDQIIGAQQANQSLGHQPVNPIITVHIAAGIIGQIDAIMAQRPENTIGKTMIILGKITVRQIRQREGDRPFLTKAQGFGVAFAAAFPRPSQPDPALTGKGAVHRGSKPARGRMAGNGGTVGYDNKTAQRTSSQLRDRAMAALISPTME